MLSSVLFVCTGNICRSPSAEGVFQAKLAQAGLEGRVTVDSAGTHGYHIGDPPDSRAIRQAAQRGYDLRHQRARKIRVQDFRDFDLILGMDSGHLSILRRLCPASGHARLQAFLDFAPNESGYRGRDVPDPYYGDRRDFDVMLDLIELGADGLLAALRGAVP